MEEEITREEMAPKEEAAKGAEKTKERIGKAGSTVKEGIVGSLKGINEIEAEIVSLVRNTVSNTLQATGSVATEGVNVTKDVLKGDYCRG